MVDRGPRGFVRGSSTSVSDTESRELAQEQAALRRVATLVARAATPDEVFTAVAEEVSQLFSAIYAGLGRFGPDNSVTLLSVSGKGRGVIPLGVKRALGGRNVNTLVFETGRPARMDSYADGSGLLSSLTEQWGIASGVGAPIFVEGRLWGILSVYALAGQTLPLNTEKRLSSFAELVGAAIANVESRTVLAGLLEEQAALRRVATLVAHGAPPAVVFSAVTHEVSLLFRIEYVHLLRYEPNGTATSVAVTGGDGTLPVGFNAKLGGDNVATMVAATGRSARIDSYNDVTGPNAGPELKAGVGLMIGTPVVVEDRLWGVMVIGSKTEALVPPDTEARLTNFTELLATAVANSNSRTELAQLAEEQDALRRVATLVASRAPPMEVFANVIEELGRLLAVEYAGLARYETDGSATFLASWGRAVEFAPAGSRWALGGKDITSLVYETGRPVRLDSVNRSGPLSEAAIKSGVRSSVGTPIIVEGRTWGFMGVASAAEQPVPSDTESRLASFTELVVMAIANAESQAELKASRARIIATADETRQRIERDLHDGIQQQIVSLLLELRLAQASVAPEMQALHEHHARIEHGLDSVLDELREISRGIHPAILTKAGLGPALKALARRSALPVELELDGERRWPEQIEVAAYYVASEALTNAAKHARATKVSVTLSEQDAHVKLAIRDDGIGGADPAHGTGLVGLFDRIEALGGRLEVASPPGRGTSLLIEIPLEDRAEPRFFDV